MTTLRESLQTGAGTLAGLALAGCDGLGAVPARARARRCELVVNGRRAKTVDVRGRGAMPAARARLGVEA